MLIERNGFVTVKPNNQFTVNNGSLCIKGWTAAEILHHPIRITKPLAKRANGQWEAISWNAAFQLIATRFKEFRPNTDVTQSAFLAAVL